MKKHIFINARVRISTQFLDFFVDIGTKGFLNLVLFINC